MVVPLTLIQSQKKEPLKNNNEKIFLFSCIIKIFEPIFFFIPLFFLFLYALKLFQNSNLGKVLSGCSQFPTFFDAFWNYFHFQNRDNSYRNRYNSIFPFFHFFVELRRRAIYIFTFHTKIWLATNRQVKIEVRGGKFSLANFLFSIFFLSFLSKKLRAFLCFLFFFLNSTHFTDLWCSDATI